MSTVYCVCRPVRNAAEVMQIIGSVLKLRACCPTLIHADSSRSHLIVTLTISSKSPNAAALGETRAHSRTHMPGGRGDTGWTNPPLSPSSPQAADCQKGHAELHQKAVVESALSPR